MMRTRALVLVFTALLLACATTQRGFGIPAEARSAVFFVRNHGKDRRGLDRLIAQALVRRGLNATPTEPAEYQYLVTYLDNWAWDMRTYLVDLRIDVRERETGILVATGRSYQSSLSAMGSTYESIVDKVVEIVAPPRHAAANP